MDVDVSVRDCFSFRFVSHMATTDKINAEYMLVYVTNTNSKKMRHDPLMAMMILLFIKRNGNVIVVVAIP